MRPQLLCVVLALAAACGPGAKTAARAPVTNQAAEDVRPARPRLTLDGALAMMPKDTELVAELDVKRLRGSVLWERIEPWIRQQGGEALGEIARLCDFDPVATLDTLLVGVKGFGRSEPDMTVFVRGFEQRAATACFERAAAAARERGDDNTLRVDGDHVELLEGGVPTMALAFVDSRTALFVSRSGTMAERAALEAARARTRADGLTGAATFTQVVGRIDTRATAWFAMDGNAPVFGGMPYAIRSVRSELHTSADPARAIVGTLVFEVGPGGDAAAMAQMFQMGIDTLRGGPYADLAQALTVSADGADVVVDVRLGLAQLERLAAMFGPLVP